ncbi:helix-turn-helix domain-containing protein [uncultured Paenibacillus sp.]|uniref:helix-turn-helix domain-containing protein n=1 Tax=uncultured Paenibacillus sp. TaxID=227322 RepID=UPI0015AAD452|nr:helix-turn-helix domain-containing protein [uncultured Paenibacillus sp.]
MQTEQLNKAVIKAKNGDGEAMWSIIAHFQDYIHKLSDRNRNLVKSQEDFEDQCFKRVEEAVHSYDPKRGSFTSHVEAKLHERLNRCKKRNIKKNGSVEVVSITSRDGVDIDFEDDLAIVDGNRIFANEKIAFLAEGDPLKLAILKAWSDGVFRPKDVTILLAQNFGGKSESHRKQITRFRSHCQTKLAYVV